jgi:hypothetical protein
MPLPVLAGVAAWIAAPGVKLASLIGGMLTLTVALAVLLGGLLNQLQQALPPEFALAIGLMPSNAPACVSAMIVAAGARWVYDAHVRIMLSAMSA